MSKKPVAPIRLSKPRGFVDMAHDIAAAISLTPIVLKPSKSSPKAHIKKHPSKKKPGKAERAAHS